MNLTSVKNAVTSKAARQMLKLQKNSPHILYGAGVVGVIGTAVLASRATLKLDSVLVGHEAKMGMINSVLENPEYDYSAEDAKRDKIVVFSKTTMAIVKTYLPAIGCGAATIACFTGSHKILSKRNVALSAAYSALEFSYNEYRKRVVDEFGEDKDREFRHAAERVEVIEETKTGPQPKDLTRVDASVNPRGYARFFGPGNPNWKTVPEYNVMFLRTVQQMANDKLHARGHVFLNEVYDSLGMERTKAGAVVGWLSDGDGDQYIDFRIWDGDNMDRFYDFVVGNEKQILLDFNVDGMIYDKI